MIQFATSLERFLARLLKRSALNSEEQDAILSLSGQRHQYAAHVDIVSPRQVVDHSCLVAEGLVGRFDQMLDGQRQITSFYIPGDMCDLHSVVAPKASWSISAVSRSTVNLIPHAQIRALAVRYPAIALAFWRDATVDASILAKWVGNLGRKGAISRLAHVFCEMGVRAEYGRMGSRISFELPATQHELADAAGMTPVHVNRMLQQLRGQDLIAFENGHVKVGNWDRLVKVAEFDPDYLMLDETPERAKVVRPALAELT